ncbi:FAD dependent oxidoreductase [Irpex rosettiformis]|uniref:FAD dependent oxidoreductase n=1 Tax=Irpex rosettiformis TaxID=378272 RepID=A0ACB8U4X7_9APHY|nr:FAD dependent oxidoreductase [Irpex rosettiformis]
MSSTQHIVIIGGGIIGCTTAYYLSHHPAYSSNTKITLLEASKVGIAQGASGKAGGLIAKWAYPKELVNLSFPEHIKLAEKYDGENRWGWRFLECGSWEGRARAPEETGTGAGKQDKRKSLEKTLGLDEGWKKKRAALGLPDDLDWVDEALTDHYSSMAPTGDTAQVHPYLFTASMLDFAKEKGATFTPGRVTEIRTDSSTGTVSGVVYADPITGELHVIDATHVVLAAGPWSPHILPSLPIIGTRAHSVTIRPTGKISPYALFTEIVLDSDERSTQATPELYARPDNEVYCCGPGEISQVPKTVDDVEVDQAACDSIIENVSGISEQLRDGKIDKRQACFLPIIDISGGPIVGEADSVAKGLIVATGHGCWGICNAPGTAKAIAELIFEGKISCGNLDSLHPSHYLA